MFCWHCCSRGYRDMCTYCHPKCLRSENSRCTDDTWCWHPYPPGSSPPTASPGNMPPDYWSWVPQSSWNSLLQLWNRWMAWWTHTSRRHYRSTWIPDKCRSGQSNFRQPKCSRYTGDRSYTRYIRPRIFPATEPPHSKWMPSWWKVVPLWWSWWCCSPWLWLSHRYTNRSASPAELCRFIIYCGPEERNIHILSRNEQRFSLSY